jgi:hypothetical protein
MGLAANGGKLGCDVFVARADLFVGGQAEADGVHFRQRVGHKVVQALAQQGAGAVQARRVHQDQLRVIPVDDSTDGVPGSLRLGGSDGHFLAHQRVGQRGLAGIGTAHQD